MTWLMLRGLLTGRNILVAIVVLIIAWQQIGLARANRQIDRLASQNQQLLTELAQARGAIQRLAQAAAELKPGETRTITVDRPVYIQVPGQTVTKEVPVVVTRTEHTIETRVQTVELPPKEIERIIREAPQSLVFDLTASRDIKEGEKFRVLASQIQPGVWQPILDLGAPITAEVRTVTPVDRIPAAPREPSRLTAAFLVGPDAFHSRGASVLTRAEIEYRLSPATSRLRQFARAEVGWTWNGAGLNGSLLYGIRY